MQEILPLTQRQKEVLDFINKFLQTNGYSPSLKETARFLKTNNLSTAQYFIDQLIMKGYLKKETYKNRGISPVANNLTTHLLGFIAAGEPIEPIENPELISIPPNIAINTRFPHYALKVRGDSMIDMGILDGDTVLIQHQLRAKNGDVVVAITENGATLKVYKERNGHIVLKPRNKKYSNINPQQLEIRGKLVGLIRNE